MLHYIPKFFTQKAIALYFVSLVAISIIFFRNSMSMLWIIFGVVETVGFFYFSNLLTKKWQKLKIKTFSKKIFSTALIIRLVWVVFSYFFYTYMTGKPFEFSAADSFAYHENGVYGANNFSNGYFNVPAMYAWLGVSDMGYSTYLSFVYLLTDNSIFIARLLKALWGAWTVLLIYRVASRNFGESTGRIAGIMAMLLPNLILYTGLHLKETEMIFLLVAFIERADYLLRSSKFNFLNVFVVLLLAGLLFTFRTVLGAAVLFALFTALLLSSKRTTKMGNRFILGVWVVLAIGYFMGGSIATEIEQVWESRGENQQNSMEWRAKREGGNILAKYGSATIFAPTIFMIPVSTMVNIDTQQNQQLMHGGNYIKNILSFFIYFIIIWQIKQKKWRDFLLLEVFFLAYLAIISLSAFAQSERFHLPAIPFYLMFVAYGIVNATNKTKKYFNWYTILIFIALVVWNFIKLKGRGLV